MTNEEAIKLIDDRMCFGRGRWSEHHRPVIDEYWQAGEMAIKALEAEPHWIPVTEDTPTKDDDYWCTFDADTGRFVDWCSWYQGRWVVWTDDTVSEVRNVIAWCKSMEPYKGVTT